MLDRPAWVQDDLQVDGAYREGLHSKKRCCCTTVILTISSRGSPSVRYSGVLMTLVSVCLSTSSNASRRVFVSNVPGSLLAAYQSCHCRDHGKPVASKAPSYLLSLLFAFISRAVRVKFDSCGRQGRLLLHALRHTEAIACNLIPAFQRVSY